MNRNKYAFSLIAISSLLSLTMGCGPQEMKDGEFLADAWSSDIVNNMPKTMDEAPTEMVAPEGEKPAAEPAAEPAAAPEAMPKGAPTAENAPTDSAAKEGCPVGASGCASGNCESPPDPDTARTVQLPDQVTVQPTKVMPTGEKQIATDIVDYKTTRHIWQPSERHHTTHKHRNLLRRHFTKLVYHPTFRRINRTVRTASVADQVMPTEEVVEPVEDYGCDTPAPQPVPVVQPVTVRRLIPVPAYGFYGRPFRY